MPYGLWCVEKKCPPPPTTRFHRPKSRWRVFDTVMLEQKGRTDRIPGRILPLWAIFFFLMQFSRVAIMRPYAKHRRTKCVCVWWDLMAFGHDVAPLHKVFKTVSRRLLVVLFPQCSSRSPRRASGIKAFILTAWNMKGGRHPFTSQKRPDLSVINRRVWTNHTELKLVLGAARTRTTSLGRLTARHFPFHSFVSPLSRYAKGGICSHASLITSQYAKEIKSSL